MKTEEKIIVIWLMAKFLASETAMQVTEKQYSFLVVYGYLKKYPVERMMRDAKVTEIYEELQKFKIVIANWMELNNKNK